MAYISIYKVITKILLIQLCETKYEFIDFVALSFPHICHSKCKTVWLPASRHQARGIAPTQLTAAPDVDEHSASGRGLALSLGLDILYALGRRLSGPLELGFTQRLE